MWWEGNAVDNARIRKIVLLKSFREQDRYLFFRAVIRAVRGAASDNQYGDGFVEWHMVDEQMEDWLEALKGEG